MRSHIEKSFVFRLLVIALFVFAVFRFDSIIATVFNVIGFFTPLLLGCGFAYAINVLMRPIERRLFPRANFKHAHALRRALAITAALLILAGFIALILWLVIPSLIDAIMVLTNSLGILFTDLQAWAERHATDFPALQEALQNLDWNTLLKTVMSYLETSTSTILSSALSVVTGIFSLAVDLILALVFMVYILFNKEKLGRQVDHVLHAYAKDKHIRRFYHIVDAADRCFSTYIIGQCIEAVILALLCALGMAIFRFPYILLVSTVVGVSALIPIVGAYIGGAVGAVMMLTESPMTAVWFLVFIIVLQQFEGNVIYPRVVGSSVGLPGIWVLAAITVGGSFGGIVGMLLGVPVFATFYKLFAENVHERNRKRVKAAAKSDAEESAPEADAPEAQAPSAPADGEHKKDGFHDLKELFHHVRGTKHEESAPAEPAVANEVADKHSDTESDSTESVATEKSKKRTSKKASETVVK